MVSFLTFLTMVGAAFGPPIAARRSNPATSDYSIELANIDRELANLISAPPDRGSTLEHATRELYLRYRRAWLTASPADFRSAQEAIDAALQRSGPVQDFILLKVSLDLKLHRLLDARHGLGLLSELADDPGVMTLKADIDLQEGRYQDARQGYQKIIQKNRTWDGLARLAYLQFITGEEAEAVRLYAEAEAEITAKEMRSYAWVELQRGLFALKRGRYEEARRHYDRADRAYSGWWLVQEHMAELLGAEGRFNEAVALYQDIITRTPRPELKQALGDLYAFMGKPELANPLHTQALNEYLDSARRGETQYFHCLATFYADVRVDVSEALEWARQDLQLRQNFATWDALAWALYRARRFAEARAAMDEALAFGVRDSHLFLHAAMIHFAVGRIEDGQRFQKQASEINPRLESFHAHR